MGQIGSLAHNFHQGARSEYLAQYVLSVFGTAIPVPRPEDTGIDLYCAIGREIGKRLLIEHYYIVQIKSDKKDIIYTPEDSTKWILSQKYPFIICIVDKKKGLIELYQTIQLARLFPEENIRKLIKLAQIWLNKNKVPFNSKWQIDVIGIKINPATGKAKVRHFKNAIKNVF